MKLLLFAWIQLLEQQKLLEQQIATARKVEVKRALEAIRALVSEFELTREDVFAEKSLKEKASTKKVEAKYRDPESGAAWSGRGKPPKCIQDKDRAQFAIQA